MDCSLSNPFACPTNGTLMLSLDFQDEILIQVSGGGILTLDVSMGRVVNNDCRSALPIFDGVSENFDTICATASGAHPDCTITSPVDVWYEYTATCTGQVTVDHTGTLGPLLAVYNTCGGAPLECVGDNTATFPAVLGTTYYVQVSGFNATGGASSINVSCEPAARFLRADVNNDTVVNIGDGVTLLAILFSRESFNCKLAQDVNDDNKANVGDVTFLLSALFSGTTTIAHPSASIGTPTGATIVFCGADNLTPGDPLAVPAEILATDCGRVGAHSIGSDSAIEGHSHAHRKTPTVGVNNYNPVGVLTFLGSRTTLSRTDLETYFEIYFLASI